MCVRLDINYKLNDFNYIHTEECVYMYVYYLINCNEHIRPAHA